MEIAYPILCDRLKEKVPQLQTIDLFNNQIEGMLADENHQYPIKFDAVLIEFQPVKWNTNPGKRTQSTECIINFHVCAELYADTHRKAASRSRAMEVLALRKKVHKALEGFAGTNFSRLNRVGTVPDVDYGNIIVFIEQYQTVLQDMTADTTAGITQVTPTLDVKRSDITQAGA